jgi:hypothetical protein
LGKKEGKKREIQHESNHLPSEVATGQAGMQRKEMIFKFKLFNKSFQVVAGLRERGREKFKF